MPQIYRPKLILKLKLNATPNVPGNAMILIAQQFAIQFANPLSAIPHAPNQKMLFVTLNAKNLNAKLNAQTKAVKCLIAQNV
jgi:hypothetical protein